MPPPSSKSSPPSMNKPIPSGVPSSTITHFSTLPLAQPTLTDPSFTIYPMSRTVTHNNRGHTLTGRTWNTPDTITHLLGLYRAADSSSPTSTTSTNENDDSGANDSPSSTTSTNPDSTTPPRQNRGEIHRFYTFGSGLNAHPDLLHGGVISSILDSTMGAVVELDVGLEGYRAEERERETEREGRRDLKEVEEGRGMEVDVQGRSGGGGERREGGRRRKVRMRFYTAQLNVRYRRPVETPGSVRCRAWVRSVDWGGGEKVKVWVEGVVEGGKEGEVRHAEAEGLWIGVRRKNAGGNEKL